MRAIEVQRFGGPEVLQEVERSDPAPAQGKVLVKVTAAAVQPVDLFARAGGFGPANPELPMLLGWDLAGEVLDGGGTAFTAGQRVAGMVPWFAERGTVGTYASVVSVSPSWIAVVPDGVDLVAASTVPLNAQTARQVLDLIGATAGQTLLVTGASGGVGGFVVELAVADGLHVIAVASTGDEAFVASLGAKEVLGRSSVEDLVARFPGGVDAVVDGAGLGPAAIAVVRDGGAFVAVTDPAQPAAERGIRTQTVHVEPAPENLAGLLSAVAAGRLTTRVAGTLPLARAAEAHERVAAGGLRGKLVLTM